jgi:hypothetical protein
LSGSKHENNNKNNRNETQTSRGVVVTTITRKGLLLELRNFGFLLADVVVVVAAAFQIKRS